MRNEFPSPRALGEGSGVRSVAIATLVSLAVFVSGCGFFTRTKSRFFSLDTIPPAAGTLSPSGGLPIGIDVVELPPGLDRREIVVRQKDLRLEVRERDQWSASLEPLVAHTLAFDLADRLPQGMVVLPGQAKPIGAMRSLDLVFEELAAGPEAAIVLDTRWILHEIGRADVAGRERLMVEIDSLDSANIASGMSRALAILADRIAAQLK